MNSATPPSSVRADTTTPSATIPTGTSLFVPSSRQPSPVTDGPQSRRPGIATGLDQGAGENALAGHHARQPRLLLFLAAELGDGPGGQNHAGGEGDGPGVASHLLGHDGGGQETEPGPAARFGQCRHRADRPSRVRPTASGRSGPRSPPPPSAARGWRGHPGSARPVPVRLPAPR